MSQARLDAKLDAQLAPDAILSSVSWRLATLCCLSLTACLEDNPDWDGLPEDSGSAASSDTSADSTAATQGESSDEASSGDGDSMGDGDSTGDGDGDGDAINGCTFESAMDLTGMDQVVISDISPWQTQHHACIIVDAGTVVRWESMSFDAHGLVGGVSGMLDPDSPITAAGPGAGSTPIDVSLTDAGTYPYYCDLHPMNMFGAVYVV